jgi:hypothetical protein
MKSRRFWLFAFCAAFLIVSMACLSAGKTRTLPQDNPQNNNQQNNNQPGNDQQDNNPQDNNPQVQPQDNNPQGDIPLDNNPPDDNPLPLDNPNPAGPFKLTGMWESQTQTEYGVVSSQLILEPTGTFSQQVFLGDLMTYDVGTYVVGDGFVHFYVTDHEPKEYLGKRMSWVNSFTYFYTPIDANTMQLEDHIMGTQWTMYRR